MAEPNRDKGMDEWASDEAAQYFSEEEMKSGATTEQIQKEYKRRKAGKKANPRWNKESFYKRDKRARDVQKQVDEARGRRLGG